jgi:cardiolipin synthase A/B
MTTHLLHQRRHPSAAIAWILFILLIPYVALPSYLSFGSRKQKRHQIPRLLPSVVPTQDGLWAISTAIALHQPAPANFRQLAIHEDGLQALSALLEVINQATHTIDICTYILRKDHVGEMIILRLCEKAHRGVQIRLLLDGFSHWNYWRSDLKRLKAAGGRFVLFVPPWGSSLKGRTNLRNHRKLVITDGELENARMWCGGRNLSAEYFDGTPGVKPWRDLTFDLSGPLVRQARTLFESDWHFATGQKDGTLGDSSIVIPFADAGAQLIASGPDQIDDTVYALLISAAVHATQRILITTPYFVPDSALLLALCLAARRGVAVDILIPKRSNHLMSDFARSRSIRSLSQAGANVWLSSDMQHGKLVVIDTVLALAGSTNIDNRSLFINYELMVAFHGKSDVNRFADWFNGERGTTTLYIAREPGLIRDLAEGMMLWIGFQL